MVKLMRAALCCLAWIPVALAAEADRDVALWALRMGGALVLEGKQYGIACHRDMPAEIIARLQSELDRLIADGTQNRIFERYGLPPTRIEQAAK